MYLFVYGTLRRKPSPRTKKKSLGKAHQRFLINSPYCGEASVKGYLYSLGEYPGLILDETSTLNIKGEIFQIEESDLHKLDEYEEIDPLSTNNEYQRIQTEITADSGERFLAWVYILNDVNRKREIIQSGDWCA
jgi:gamma-glutamylcyclotransferase (GGCT)/AIG2-like uncharacterized protein YtfP